MTQLQLECIENIENLGFPDLAERLRISEITYFDSLKYINEVYDDSTREEFSNDEYNILYHSVMQFFFPNYIPVLTIQLQG